MDALARRGRAVAEGPMGTTWTVSMNLVPSEAIELNSAEPGGQQ